MLVKLKHAPSFVNQPKLHASSDETGFILPSAEPCRRVQDPHVVWRANGHIDIA
jgi:hypothetical protein